MKKYELRKCLTEVNDRDSIIEGCTQDQTDINSELVAEFEDKEKALDSLKNYTTKIKELSGGAGRYYEVTEYFVEENEYEDDEWVSGGDILDYSKM